MSRLCHLTPVRNFVHLASDDAGLLSLRQLAAASGDHDQQDLERLDGHPDHICCSIEYPNAWYLERRHLQATPIQRLFPDWVCLGIDPVHLSNPGTRVCVRNAAARHGELIKDVSPEAFDELYGASVCGANGRVFRRSAQRISASPTDDQAEVLVHRAIPLSDVQSVIVRSLGDAKRFHALLDQIGARADSLRWIIAPTLFDKRALSAAIAAGTRPEETAWGPE